MNRSINIGCVVLALIISFTPILAEEDAKTAAPAGNNPASDPLVRVLLSKGVISAEEARYISSGSAADQREKLLFLLKDKGLLTRAELEALNSPVTQATAEFRNAVYAVAAESSQQRAPEPAKSPAPKVVPAVAPLRVLQLEPSKKDGLVPDVKLGTGARLKFYGLVKASAIYDSSSPYGTDMPLPGFITNSALPGATFDSGPNPGKEFHVKARFARIGTNFEFPDISNKLTFTGKLEFDFEGNFTRVLNRNISTIRSSVASIRLAYGRVDYKVNDDTSWFLLFGQDWTPFGSSTLPNLVETTGLGLGFGTLYERDPQVRFGMAHIVGGSRKLTFAPEFAIVLPAYGNDPRVVDDQLGYGERQGADSGRPEIQGRFVTQWQLDKAPGVAPAQLIASFVQGSRTAIIKKEQVPLCTAVGCPSTTVFQAAFPQGAETSTDRWGVTGEMQLPTRYVTILAKYWTGADLRWYFVGSLLSVYNDTAGLLVPTSTSSIDGGSTVFFALNGTTPILVPQRPVRAQGGFVNLGFPLGRIFHADPASRAATWQLYLHYAYDEAKARDVRKTGGAGSATLINQRNKNDLAVGTLTWKANSLVTFALEESLYRTRMAGGTTAWGAPTGWPTWIGKPARSWHDTRTEFATIFTF